MLLLNWKFLWLFYFEKIARTVQTDRRTGGRGATLIAAHGGIIKLGYKTQNMGNEGRRQNETLEPTLNIYDDS